jgi:hypothetical protein
MLKSIDHDFKGYLSDNSHAVSNTLMTILTKSFKPIIENAHKKFVRDNYSTVFKKVETDRLFEMGKSDVDSIYEKYFKKSLTRSESTKNFIKDCPKKQTLKRKSSFLIENNFIDKNDILKNPSNRNYLQILKTPKISLHDQFYEREKILYKNYEEKKNQMRTLFESKILSEMKPSPGITKGSQKIIEKKNLDKKPPLHLRSKELAEEKILKQKYIQKDLKRNSSINMFFNKTTFSGSLNSGENIKLNDTINNLNCNKNGFIFKNKSSKLVRSKSYNGKDFGDWLEINNRWNKLKESKKDSLKKINEEHAKDREEKSLTFKPIIDEKSKHIIELKNKNEDQEINIFDKLYNLNKKKNECIQNLQQKYKPTFKPSINKYPQFLNNNTINQTTKSFYLEKKEDEYEQIIPNIILNKNNDNTLASLYGKEKPQTRESIEFNKFLKEVEKNKFIHQNKRSNKKSKKEIEEFFCKMNKGMSPNYGLEINDIKFYNDIHKN